MYFNFTGEQQQKVLNIIITSLNIQKYEYKNCYDFCFGIMQYFFD